MRYTCLDVRSPDVNFLRKVMSSSRHDGAAYSRHPCRQSADADIVSAFPLPFSTFLENINILRQTSSTWHRIRREFYVLESFQKPVAPAGYKNKQCRKQTSVLSGRIVTAYVPLRSATERERAAFLIPCQGLRGFDSISLLTFHLQLCGPLGQIPDLGSQAIVEFRLMADHENTALVFFQCPFQLVFGIHIQMVRWLVQ